MVQEVQSAEMAEATSPYGEGGTTVTPGEAAALGISAQDIGISIPEGYVETPGTAGVNQYGVKYVNYEMTPETKAAAQASYEAGINWSDWWEQAIGPQLAAIEIANPPKTIESLPAYYSEAKIGDTETRMVMQRLGVPMDIALEMQAQKALAGGYQETTLSRHYRNELDKWGTSQAAIQSSFVHHQGIESGVPTGPNPYEHYGDVWLAFQKGAPEVTGKGQLGLFNPATVRMLDLLPNREGLQGYGWDERMGKAQPANFIPALTYLESQKGLLGPYENLGAYSSAGFRYTVQEQQAISLGQFVPISPEQRLGTPSGAPPSMQVSPPSIRGIDFNAIYPARGEAGRQVWIASAGVVAATAPGGVTPLQQQNIEKMLAFGAMGMEINKQLFKNQPIPDTTTGGTGPLALGYGFARSVFQAGPVNILDISFPPVQIANQLGYKYKGTPEQPFGEYSRWGMGATEWMTRQAGVTPQQIEQTAFIGQKTGALSFPTAFVMQATAAVMKEPTTIMTAGAQGIILAPLFEGATAFTGASATTLKAGGSFARAASPFVRYSIPMVMTGAIGYETVVRAPELSVAGLTQSGAQIAPPLVAFMAGPIALRYAGGIKPMYEGARDFFSEKPAGMLETIRMRDIYIEENPLAVSGQSARVITTTTEEVFAHPKILGIELPRFFEPRSTGAPSIVESKVTTDLLSYSRDVLIETTPPDFGMLYGREYEVTRTFAGYPSQTGKIIVPSDLLKQGAEPYLLENARMLVNRNYRGTGGVAEFPVYEEITQITGEKVTFGSYMEDLATEQQTIWRRYSTKATAFGTIEEGVTLKNVFTEGYVSTPTGSFMGGVKVRPISDISQYVLGVERETISPAHGATPMIIDEQSITRQFTENPYLGPAEGKGMPTYEVDIGRFQSRTVREGVGITSEFNYQAQSASREINQMLGTRTGTQGRVFIGEEQASVQGVMDRLAMAHDLGVDIRTAPPETVPFGTVKSPFKPSPEFMRTPLSETFSETSGQRIWKRAHQEIIPESTYAEYFRNKGYEISSGGQVSKLKETPRELFLFGRERKNLGVLPESSEGMTLNYLSPWSRRMQMEEEEQFIAPSAAVLINQRTGQIQSPIIKPATITGQRTVNVPIQGFQTKNIFKSDQGVKQTPVQMPTQMNIQMPRQVVLPVQKPTTTQITETIQKPVQNPFPDTTPRITTIPRPPPVEIIKVPPVPAFPGGGGGGGGYAVPGKRSWTRQNPVGADLLTAGRKGKKLRFPQFKPPKI